MKRRLALFLTMISVATAVLFAAITSGNNVSKGSTDSNNVVATASISTTGAALLVGAISSYQLGVSEALMSDSLSNTWPALTARFSTNNRIRIAYVANPVVGGTHSFGTVSGTADYPANSVQAFLGADTSSPFDAESGASDTLVTTLATGTVSPSANGEVLFACLSIGLADTPTMGGSGWVAPFGVAFDAGHAEGIWCSYKIQTAATTEGATFNWSTPGEAAAAIASFKAAGSGVTTVCGLATIGVGCDYQPHVSSNSSSVSSKSPFSQHQAGQIIRTHINVQPNTKNNNSFITAEDYTSNISRFASGVRKLSTHALP